LRGLNKASRPEKLFKRTKAIKQTVSLQAFSRRLAVRTGYNFHNARAAPAVIGKSILTSNESRFLLEPGLLTFSRFVVRVATLEPS